MLNDTYEWRTCLWGGVMYILLWTDIFFHIIFLTYNDVLTYGISLFLFRTAPKSRFTSHHDSWRALRRSSGWTQIWPNPIPENPAWFLVCRFGHSEMIDARILLGLDDQWRLTDCPRQSSGYLSDNTRRAENFSRFITGVASSSSLVFLLRENDQVL